MRGVLLLILLLCFSPVLATRMDSSKSDCLAKGYSWVDLDSGLVAYWRMNEVSGTSVYDASGYGKTGSTFGTCSWGVGVNGRGLDLDGSSCYVNLDSHAGSMPTSAFTVSLWLNYSAAASYQYMFGYGGDSDAKGYVMIYDSITDRHLSWCANGLSCAVGGTCLSTPGFVASEGSVYHFVGSWDGSNLKIYVNGALVNSTTCTGTVPTSTYLRLGNENARSYYTNGVLDEVRVYNRALVQAEIISLYNNTRYSIYSGCCGDDRELDTFYSFNTACYQGKVSNNFDLIRGFALSEGYSWFSGTPSFSATSIWGPENDVAKFSEPVDIDNDGDLDLIFSGGYNLYKGVNDGSGVFTISSINTGSYYFDKIVIGDFNKDGYLDFITGRYDRIIKWINNGAGGFTGSDVYVVTSTKYSLVALDINDDGHLDFLAKSGTNLLRFVNDGTGSFTMTDLGSLSGQSMAAGDIDGDGDLDVIASSSSGLFKLTNNAGSLTQSTISSTGYTIYSVALADVDNDGDLDIITDFNYASLITLWTNDGTGGFTSSTIADSMGGIIKDIDVGDLNSDGWIDIQVVAFPSSNYAFCYLINNQGSFSKTCSGTGADYSMSTGSLGDFDGDGDLDYIALPVFSGPVNNYLYFWNNSMFFGRTGPACGDDRANDLFHNSSLYCYKGQLVLDYDYSDTVCSFVGYDWFTGGINYFNQSFYNWTDFSPIPGTSVYFYSAISDEGGSMIVGGAYGRLYVSRNYNFSLSEVQPSGDYDRNWYYVAISRDGGTMMASYDNGYAYASNNSGVSWYDITPSGLGGNTFQCVSMNSNGSLMMLGVRGGGRLYKSINYGVSWSEVQPAGAVDKYWATSAMSSNGSIIIAGAAVDRLYLSTDYGSSWSEVRPAGDSNKYWQISSMSSDGRVILVGAYRLYLSTDYGSSWSEVRPIGDVDRSWGASAMSSDGSVILVGLQEYTYSSRLYISNDTGSIWSELTPAGAVDKYWASASITSDGKTLLAGTDRLYLTRSIGPCCGDDGALDSFYSANNYCYQGNYNNLETSLSACSFFGYDWFTGAISGNSTMQRCCGNDGVSDNFYNGTVACIESDVYSFYPDKYGPVCELAGGQFFSKYSYDYVAANGWDEVGTGDYAMYSDFRVVDFDCDGDDDVIYFNYGGYIGLYEWTGSSYAERFGGYTCNAGMPPCHCCVLSMDVVDWDGDGVIEVVTGSADGKVRLWDYDGGVFSETVLYNYGSRKVRALKVADLDLDDDFDIVVVLNETTAGYDPNGEFHRLLNVTSSFSDSNILDNEGGQSFFEIHLADLNGDDYPDLVGCDRGGPGLYQLINTGAGGFGSRVTLDSNLCYDVDVGDIDLDGDNDIISGNNVNYHVNVRFNNGDASYSTTTLSAVRTVLGVGLADLNADNYLDIIYQSSATSSPYYRAYVCYYNASGYYCPGIVLTLDDHTYDFQGIDYYKDGDIDIIAKEAYFENTYLSGNNGSCCGDDSSELFGNSSHTCYNGGVYTDPDASLSVCSFRGKTWITGATGMGAPCCGDDTSEYFYNNPDVSIADQFCYNSVYYWSELDRSSTLCSYYGGTWLSVDYFGNRTDVTPGYMTSTGAVVDDFDSDGHDDFAVLYLNSTGGGYYPFIGVNFGYGNYSFKPMAKFNISDFGNSWLLINDFVGVDIDGDGDTDLIGCFYGRNYFTIAINDGLGNFTTLLPFSLTSGCTNVRSGDIDFDGDVDLILNQYDDNLTIYRNISGTLTRDAERFATGKGSALADFDEDGDLDVVVANFGAGNGIGFFRNDGVGNFFNNANYTTNISYPSYIYVDDLNNDDNDDVIILFSSANRIMVFFGDGFGVLTYSKTYVTASNPYFMVTTDVNVDGYPDLLVSQGTNSFGYYENNGDGTFKSYVATTTGPSGAYSNKGIASGDFDEDGIPDVVVNDYTYYNYFRGLNKFTKEACCTDDPSEYFYGGLIGSTTNFCHNSVVISQAIDSSQTLCNYYNYTWFTGSTTGDYSYCCGDDGASDDFTNGSHTCVDGASFIEYDYSSAVCTGSGYKWLIGPIYGNSSLQGCCGDDGANDLFYNNTLICSRGVIIDDADSLMGYDYVNHKTDYTTGKYFCEFNGSTWLGASTSYYNTTIIDSSIVSSGTEYYYAVLLMDLNNDSFDDIIVSKGSYLWKLINNQDGTFATKEVLLTPAHSPLSYNIIRDDFDNDGHEDIAFNGNGYLEVWYGDSLGNFTGVDLGTGLSYSYIDSGDINNDGYKDITGGDGSGNIYVWFGDGDDFNKVNVGIPNPNDLTGVSLGDINGDGSLDMIASYSDAPSRIYGVNDELGNFSFSNVHTGNAWNNVPSILFDIDGDGDLDIIAAYADTIIRHVHYGGGSFSSSQNVALISGNVDDSAFGDMDNDGLIDVISTSFKNDVNIINPRSYGYRIIVSQIQDYSTTSSTIKPVVGDLNNDGALDIVISRGAYNSSSPLGSYYSALYAIINKNTGGSNGPCCGDDGVSDNFYNLTTSCKEGVITEFDSWDEFCEWRGYTWFSNISGGTNSPCCGDDSSIDDFYNYSLGCVNGVVTPNYDLSSDFCSNRYNWFYPRVFYLSDVSWHEPYYNYRHYYNISSVNSYSNAIIHLPFDTYSLIQRGDMQSDCDDVRIYDENGLKIIYWLFNCNSNNSQLYFKVPSLTANVNKTILIYYGNSTDVSESNQESIMLFYDNFSGTSFKPEWNQYPTDDTYWLDNGYLKIDTNADSDSWDTKSNAPFLYWEAPGNETTDDYVIVTRLSGEGVSSYEHIGLAYIRAITPGAYNRGYFGPYESYYYSKFENDGGRWTSCYINALEYWVRFRKIGTMLYYDLSLDNVEWNPCDSYDLTTWIPKYWGLLSKTWTYGGLNATFDEFYVYKYTPVNVSFREETGPCCGDDASLDTFYNDTIICYEGQILNDLDVSQDFCSLLSKKWFTGTVTGSNGACCGDDSSSDNFYNGTIGATTHFCYEGLFTEQEIDANQSICEHYGYSWMTGASGPDTKCCGDDAGLDDFGNNTGSCCCNGVTIGNGVECDLDNDGNIDSMCVDGTLPDVFISYSTYDESYVVSDYSPQFLVKNTGNETICIISSDISNVSLSYAPDPNNIECIEPGNSASLFYYFSGFGCDDFDKEFNPVLNITYQKSSGEFDNIIRYLSFRVKSPLDIVSVTPSVTGSLPVALNDVSSVLLTLKNLGTDTINFNSTVLVGDGLLLLVDAEGKSYTADQLKRETFSLLPKGSMVYRIKVVPTTAGVKNTEIAFNDLGGCVNISDSFAFQITGFVKDKGFFNIYEVSAWDWVSALIFTVIPLIVIYRRLKRKH